MSMPNINTGEGFENLGDFYKDSVSVSNQNNNSNNSNYNYVKRTNVIFPNLSKFKPNKNIYYLDEKYFTSFIDYFNINYNNVCQNYTFVNLLDYYIIVNLTVLQYSYSPFLKQSIDKCIINNSFGGKLFIPIKLITNNGGHSNLIIIDLNEKMLYFFEPHGEQYGGSISTFINIESKIYNIIKEIFTSLNDFKVSNIFDKCILGVQTKQGLASRSKTSGGFCLGWSLLFINLIIINPNISINNIKAFFDRITPDKLNTYINKYVVYVISKSQNNLSKLNINMMLTNNIILSINEFNLIKNAIKHEIEFNYINVFEFSNKIFELFYKCPFYNQLYFKYTNEIKNYYMK